ncbi:hypothetical protein [Pseudonocardia nigra]|uniref:hypothetical protein n=1 Tax=Pseudonocardia nigra TaxID=1921578 RepID=UPI001C6049CF|nr:hypothetical protein [Pseudonocardia nigra]
MDYEQAKRWMERVDPVVARGPDWSITRQLDWFKEQSKDGGVTRDAAAAWYAMVHEMRRLADYYERDLIRRLRADGLTWAQVADAVQAQLSSRQAAQAKWKRLIDPGRRITTGDMQRGGRRKQTGPGTPS